MSDTYNAEVAQEGAEQLEVPAINPLLGLSAPVQTTYPAVMPVGLPGMPASMVNWDGDTRIVETAAGIGFGLAVSKGATDRGIVIGGASKFAGITYRDITLFGPTVDVYPQYTNAGIMVRGDIWVAVGAAVVAGTAANFVAATGVITSGAGTAIPNSIWMTSQATVGGLAILRLYYGPIV